MPFPLVLNGIYGLFTMKCPSSGNYSAYSLQNQGIYSKQNAKTDDFYGFQGIKMLGISIHLENNITFVVYRFAKSYGLHIYFRV